MWEREGPVHLGHPPRHVGPDVDRRIRRARRASYADGDQDRRRLRDTDGRRTRGPSGSARCIPPGSWRHRPAAWPRWRDLGPDALTDLPSAGILAQEAAGRRVAIKTLLLDQRFLAGLGNIYANEVLYEARVDGTRPAGSLILPEMRAIRTAICSVLAAGLEHGGTSLDDLAYLLPDGRAGRHLDYLAVYGREGHPCRRCRTPILRNVIGGRSSYRCPACQT